MLERVNCELERVKSELENYTQRYRKESLPPLELSDIYALFPDRLKPSDEVKYKWSETWPCSSSSGVYFLFTENGELLYIGTAWQIGGRLGKYFHYDKDRRCKIVRTWSKDPAYLVILAVPKGMSFEAAALEEYFIERLGTLDNKVGRLKDDVSEAKVY